jgi:hypothetical protein
LISISLCVATTLRLAVWLWRPSKLEATAFDHTDVARRQLMLGSIISLGAGLFLAFTRDKLTQYVLGDEKSDRPLRGVRINVPRFIPRKKRELRLVNFRVLKDFPQKATFLLRAVNNARQRITVHYANGHGKVRFFSAASDITKLQAIGDVNAAETKWLQSAGVESVDTRQWEAAALDRIEAGRIEDALKLLVAGVRLTLTPTRHRQSIRLLDLLAGISIRYEKQGERYFAELQTMILGLNSNTKLKSRLTQRVEKWRDLQGKWRKHWTDRSKPLRWHHPLETRDFSWERKRQFKRPVPNPETRQRPVKTVPAGKARSNRAGRPPLCPSKKMRRSCPGALALTGEAAVT